MKTPVFIKARVCVHLADETLCTTHEKKVVLAFIEDNKGNLLDGREVFKIDNWWYYIPPRGEITTSWEHEKREPPKMPEPPQPPVTKPEPQPVTASVEKTSEEKPKEKPKGFFRL